MLTHSGGCVTWSDLSLEELVVTGVWDERGDQCGSCNQGPREKRSALDPLEVQG